MLTVEEQAGESESGEGLEATPGAPQPFPELNSERQTLSLSSTSLNAIRPGPSGAAPSQLTDTDNATILRCDSLTNLTPEERPDFSSLPDLPDEVWLQVGKMLPVQDRYALSKTCQRLDALFCCASLWKSVTLPLYSHELSTGWLIDQWQHRVVNKFGRWFQEVVVETSSTSIDQETVDTLLKLSQCKSLERILFKIQIQASFSTQIRKLSLQGTDMDSLIYLLSHTKPSGCDLQLDLSYLVRKQAPFTLCSATEVLSVNRHKYVRSLDIRLDGCCSLNNYVYPRNPQTLANLARFPSLRHLRLCDFMFSDRLLNSLRDTCRMNGGLLQTLTVDFYRNHSARVEELSPEAWSRLVEACPHLEVHCHISRFIRQANLNDMLPTEAPVVSIELYRDQNLTRIPHIDYFIMDHYQTLRRLEVKCFVTPVTVTSVGAVYEQGRWREFNLTNEVTNCPQLVDLHYNAPVDYRDILGLLELGREWKSFVFGETVLVLDDPTETERLATEGEMAWLEGMVSRRLGYRWRLIPTHMGRPMANS